MNDDGGQEFDKLMRDTMHVKMCEAVVRPLALPMSSGKGIVMPYGRCIKLAGHPGVHHYRWRADETDALGVGASRSAPRAR